MKRDEGTTMAWWMIAAALATMAGQQDMAAMPGMEAPAVACPAKPAPLPADLAGWTAMGPVTAAAGAAAAAPLTLGASAKLALLPAASVAYAAVMKHPGTPGSFGGNVAFTVASAGRYRVALAEAAWIDVAQGATALPSVAHGHGPACSGVRKTVDFDLTPGRYVLQIAGNETPTVGIMVTRLPG